MTDQPNPEQVRQLWQHLEQKYRTRVFNKASAPLMRVGARIVGRRTDIDPERFLDAYATTIGRRIYLPFEPGEPHPNFDLLSQLLLASHEHTHVLQWRREGRLRWWRRYNRSTRWRAIYEVEAFLAEYETLDAYGIDAAAWGPLGERIDTLEAYGCTDADREAAANWVLDARLDRLQNGPVTRVGRHLVEWLGRSASGGDVS